MCVCINLWAILRNSDFAEMLCACMVLCQNVFVAGVFVYGCVQKHLYSCGEVNDQQVICVCTYVERLCVSHSMHPHMYIVDMWLALTRWLESTHLVDGLCEHTVLAHIYVLHSVHTHMM